MLFFLAYFSPTEPPPPPPPEPKWEEIESDVVHLSEENFKSFLKKKKHCLVMFYAPCKYTMSSLPRGWKPWLVIYHTSLNCSPFLIFSTATVQQLAATIRAASWENLLMPYANNKDPDQPQAAPSSIPMSGTFFRGDLVMKTFLRPFSLFRWFKKSSCQLLAKECALSTGKLTRRLAQEQCG